MTTTLSRLRIKGMMLGIAFLVPLLMPFRLATASAAVPEAVLEGLALADAPVATRDNLPANPEQKGDLSDGWKYTIAVLVMVFFLGLAIFVQLRAEREK